MLNKQWFTFIKLSSLSSSWKSSSGGCISISFITLWWLELFDHPNLCKTSSMTPSTLACNRQILLITPTSDHAFSIEVMKTDWPLGMKKIARIEPCFDANLMQAETCQRRLNSKDSAKRKWMVLGCHSTRSSGCHSVLLIADATQREQATHLTFRRNRLNSKSQRTCKMFFRFKDS